MDDIKRKQEKQDDAMLHLSCELEAVKESTKSAHKRIDRLEENRIGDDIMSKKIFTMDWFKAAGIRALKTMAQTAIATIGTSAVFSDVNWLIVASSSALAGILSLLTSIAGLPEVTEPKTANTVDRIDNTK